MPGDSGYSGTSLTKKLGIKPSYRIVLINQPEDYWKLFDLLPNDIVVVENPKPESTDFIHLFCETRKGLQKHAKHCKSLLKKNGTLWVSWPKGSSKIPTDIKREHIREHMLSLGLVDIKLASINMVWSGLKFVYRIKDR